jgi:pyrimidine-nucleoside phosphorylase
MNTVDLINKKQAGGELTTGEIQYLIDGYTYSKIPDYQIAALLMAIYFQGMTHRETIDLVRIMVESGKTAHHNQSPFVKVDKHSTGGVGDKVSLLVAPIAASQGVPVPMISGRGLGHTGGTLDKLESIPGFSTRLSLRAFEIQVAEIGCALIGQTDEIVPADQKMYALRDVTATVRSIPLITSSILSKKIAEGVDALLLDVKFGSGAVFQSLEGARQLAGNLVRIGTESGLEVRALLTDMSQPLGQAVGNWIEVRECLDIMTGKAAPDDLVKISLAQAAIMLILGKKAVDYDEGLKIARQAVESGAALNKFVEIAKCQQADTSYLENPDKYTAPAYQKDITADDDAYIANVDALTVGLAAVELGAGRRRKEDSIDYTAGIYLHKKRGDRVAKGDILATLYTSMEEINQPILSSVSDAFRFSKEPPASQPLIVSELSVEGEKHWNH